MSEENKTLSEQELRELSRAAGSPLAAMFHIEIASLIENGIKSEDVLRIGQAVISVLACTFIDFIFQKDAPLREKNMFCDILNQGIKESLSTKQFMCEASDAKH